MNTTSVASATPATSYAGPSRLILLTAPLLVLGLAVLFWTRFQWIFHISVTDSFYSAWPLIPVVSGVVAFSKRHHIERDSGSVAGLALVSLSVILTLLLDATETGLYSATPILLVLALSGVVVVAWGLKALRTLAFPLLFLLFLVPIQPSIRARVDYPLQELCARVTVVTAQWVGIHLHREGAALRLSNAALGVNVAPACNGLRSALALVLGGVLYVYLVRASWYRKAAVLAAVIPLAYFANFVRLFGIICFLNWGGPKLSGYEPLFDHVTGAVIFSLAIILLFLWARVLRCSQFQKVG